MDISVADEEWDVVAESLPLDWRESARTLGALKRARRIKDADTLLRLILLHSAGGLSLRQATARAKAQKLASVTDVALLHRLREAEPWLRAMTQQMLERSRLAPRKSVLLPNRRVRVVDATDVKEPGSTGTDWRVHYTLRLPSLACDFFEVTDAKGGETYKRIPVRPGDVILGDRGYANRQGVGRVLRKKGDVVVRLNSTSFPLLDAEGRPFELLPSLRKLKGLRPREWPVQFNDEDGNRRLARVCAVRKSRTAAERAKNRARKASAKKHKKTRPETLEIAEYVVILTTLPLSLASAEQVLELYRARWQVELAFKRIKSLLGAGHVPKYNPKSARAWLQAKLLTVLLTESLIDRAGLFSPWGFDLASAQHMA